MPHTGRDKMGSLYFVVFYISDKISAAEREKTHHFSLECDERTIFFLFLIYSLSFQLLHGILLSRTNKLRQDRKSPLQRVV